MPVIHDMVRIYGDAKHDLAYWESYLKTLGVGGRWFEWETHVEDGLGGLWAHLSLETRFAVFVMAREAARNSESGEGA